MSHQAVPLYLWGVWEKVALRCRERPRHSQRECWSTSNGRGYWLSSSDDRARVPLLRERLRSLPVKTVEFKEVRDGVFATYANQLYLDGVGLIRRARPQFHDRDGILTFWEACLSSMGGDAEYALDVLLAGLDRGLAWHPRMLADPDLDAARELEGWREFEERSAAMLADLNPERPDASIRSPSDPAGTVIALHGAGENPSEFFSEWAAAVPADWALIAPVGDVPRSNDSWAWPYDLATDSLVEALVGQSLTDPIVMAGFSQGARLGAKAAWNGLYEVAGVVLIAGGLTVETWQESHRHPVPLYVVVGTEDDISYGPCMAIARELDRAGVPVNLDIREGLGHELPGDLGDVVRGALDWISSRSTWRVAGTDP